MTSARNGASPPPKQISTLELLGSEYPPAPSVCKRGEQTGPVMEAVDRRNRYFGGTKKRWSLFAELAERASMRGSCLKGTGQQTGQDWESGCRCHRCPRTQEILTRPRRAKKIVPKGGVYHLCPAHWVVRRLCLSMCPLVELHWRRLRAGWPMITHSQTYERLL